MPEAVIVDAVRVSMCLAGGLGQAMLVERHRRVNLPEAQIAARTTARSG